MTLKKPIQFEPGKTIYIRINYTNLLKKRSFVITATYPTAIYIVLDNNTPKIAILMNPIKKYLEFNKNIRLGTIYKYIDTTYIITDIIKAFVTVTTTFSILLDPFSTI